VGVFADRTTLVLPWGPAVNLSVSPEARSEPRTLNGVEFWDLGLSEDLTQFALMGSGPTVHVGTGAAGKIEMAWTAEVPGGLGVAITNDGSVAVGTASGIVLFDPGGTRRRLLQAPVLQAVQPAISPSGRLVAAGDLSGSVWIWDAEANDGAGKLLAEVRGHKGRVSGIGFRSETDLVTGGWDATVRRWDLSSINQDPTPEELSAAWDVSLEELLSIAP
jgi:WD40 repeat protein